MVNIKEKFKEFQNKSFYSRIDALHPLELLIGLDEKGQKSIKLRAEFVPKQIKGTAAIEVKQYKKESYSTLVFSLVDNEIASLFYLFCEDIVESTREIKDVNLGYQSLINRFFQWKKLFNTNKKNILTEPEIMGLIGELYFLSTELFDKYGQRGALMGWSGQELTHKDFSYDNDWYEVKTINKSSQTVKISSIEQLCSNTEGSLIVILFEKMSQAFNGLSLNSYIKKIYDSIQIDEDKELFLNKVAIQGFSFNDEYDKFVYAYCETKKFLVGDEFPRLTKENISSIIVKAQYELSLKDLIKYELK
jgi:hypothetical protein